MSVSVDLPREGSCDESYPSPSVTAVKNGHSLSVCAIQLALVFGSKLGVENRRSDAVAGGGSGAVRWATDVLHLPPGIPGISHLSAVNKK